MDKKTLSGNALVEAQGICDLAGQLGFSEVTFIDRNGEAVLAQIITQSAEFVAKERVHETIVKEPAQWAKRSLVKEGREHGRSDPR